MKNRYKLHNKKYLRVRFFFKMSLMQNILTKEWLLLSLYFFSTSQIGCHINLFVCPFMYKRQTKVKA